MVTGGRIVRVKMRLRDEAGDEHQNRAEQHTDATHHREWQEFALTLCAVSRWPRSGLITVQM
jgi:hypothetical protein